MQEVGLGHTAFVATVEVFLHVVYLTLDQLRLHFFQESHELGRSQLLMRAVSLRVLIEEVLGVNLALNEDLLDFLDDLLRVDSGKFVDKLVKVDAL